MFTFFVLLFGFFALGWKWFLLTLLLGFLFGTILFLLDKDRRG
jgi:hypothetical protein